MLGIKGNRRLSKKKIPAWLKWLRGISCISIFAGGFGLMSQPELFWYSVIAICGGLVLVIVDLYLEPGVGKKFKVTVGAAISIALVVFVWRVVLASAPLKILMLSDNNVYAHGTKVSGIQW